MEFYPLPQPEEIEIREREDAMGAYLMMFAAIGAGLPFPFLNLLAAVIYYYINRNKGRFVHFHLVQSLYSQIPVTLLNSVAVVWCVSVIIRDGEFTRLFGGYIAMVVIVNIGYFIFSIVAAIRARKGEFYYFPVFGRIAYQMAFVKKEEDDPFVSPINQPPA